MRDPLRPARHSIRLRGHNYSDGGAYFVTLCAQDRACVFGAVDSGEMHLSPGGLEIVRTWTEELPRRFSFIQIDRFVLMPNHLHGILRLPNEARHMLGRVVAAFKSITTVEWTRQAELGSWPTFRGRLWQRNYYDRVIRNDCELERVRFYIDRDPLDWHDDPENPHMP